jgi:hypothetical protein
MERALRAFSPLIDTTVGRSRSGQVEALIGQLYVCLSSRVGWLDHPKDVSP